MDGQAELAPLLIEPRYVAVGKLFSEKPAFVVPKYQRGYAWEADEIEDFWKDVAATFEQRAPDRRHEHFFGGVVCVERRIPGTGKFSYEVVDGQQRLATFVLLGHVLIEKCLELAEAFEQSGDASSADLLRRRAHRLREHFIEHEDEQDRRPVTLRRLTLSNVDQVFFTQILDKTLPATDARDSHRRLRQAAVLLDEAITSRLDGMTPAQRMDALRTFEEVLNDDCTLIQITSNRTKEAYRLFQVLNDRGMSLTAGDLLRARSLELLDPVPVRKHQPVAESIWDEILAGTASDTENFLRWYFSARQGKPPRKAALFDEFADAFFPSVDTPLKDPDAKKFIARLEELRTAVRIMQELLDGNWPYDQPDPKVPQWDRYRVSLLLKELGHTNCMPLAYAAASKLDQSSFAKVVLIVEKFAYRYKFVCNEHISRATNIYLKHAKKVLEESKYKIAELQTDLRGLLEQHASDAVFEQLLSETRYSTTGSNKPLKYLLVTLDDHWPWFKKGATGNAKVLDKTRPFDFSNTTLEHIYPQKAEAATKTAKLEKVKHSLGNITLLGPADQDAAGNQDPKAKLPLLGQTTSNMNKDLGKLANWTEARIKARQGELLRLAKLVYKL